jgi:hypothetical protein
MISALVCLVVLPVQLSVGQAWSYQLIWHFVGKDIDITEEEAFDVSVTKVLKESVTAKISQKLTASLYDGQRFPTDPKAVPAVHEWAFSPTGSVAFMPNARFGLESRFFRLLKGVLPAPKGDPLRDQQWTLEYPDDGLGIEMGRLRGRILKGEDKWTDFSVSYRENGGTSGFGKFSRAKEMLFPQNLEFHFSNTKMQGGTDVVDCDLTMKLREPKKASG